MSGDMDRVDFRLTLLEIWFKKLWNHANNIFCKDTLSKNYIIIFTHKIIAISYCILL